MAVDLRRVVLRVDVDEQPWRDVGADGVHEHVHLAMVGDDLAAEVARDRGIAKIAGGEGGIAFGRERLDLRHRVGAGLAITAVHDDCPGACRREQFRRLEPDPGRRRRQERYLGREHLVVHW